MLPACTRRPGGQQKRRRANAGAGRRLCYAGRQALEHRPTSDLRSLFDYTPGVNFVGGSYNPLNEVEIRGMGSQSSDVMGNGANRVTMDLDGMEMSPGLSYGYYTRTGR